MFVNALVGHSVNMTESDLQTVVVIGSGIAGLSTAYHIAKYGGNTVNVTLLEKVCPNAHCSTGVLMQGFTFSRPPHTYTKCLIILPHLLLHWQVSVLVCTFCIHVCEWVHISWHH